MVRSIFILTLLILSCSRKDDKSSDSLTQSDSVTVAGQKDKKGKCNSSLDNKVYQYRYDSEMSDDYLFTLIFKCEQNGLDGKIFGPDPEGEHGLWFFRADLENLKVDSLSNIEFEFSQGYLYPDRITMDNYLDSLNTDNAGFSRGQIYYKGKISGDSIVFKCNPEYDCYDEAMTFRVKN
jgi:hypothetical protein